MAQTPLRPRDLTRMDGDVITDIQENKVIPGPVPEDPDDTRESHGTAEEWIVPLDSIKHTGDEGTLGVPMSRIAMRDINGLIPASMLPSYVDDMIFGELTVTSSKVTFVETVSGSSTHRTYVSPESQRGTGELAPPENIVYCDVYGTDPTNLRYRYIASRETVSPMYGFEEIPGSRAIETGYGLQKVDSSSASLTLSALRPCYCDQYGASAFQLVGNKTGIGNFGGTSLAMSVLNTANNDGFTVTKTRQDGYGHFYLDLTLLCFPTTPNGNIINLNLMHGDNVVATQSYDMSSTAVATSEDVVRFTYWFSLTPDTPITLALRGEANNAVTVKVQRLYIIELI